MCKPHCTQGKKCEKWNGVSWSNGTTFANCPVEQARLAARQTGFNTNRMLADELTALRKQHPALEFNDRTAYTAAAKILRAAGFEQEAKIWEAKAQSGNAGVKQPKRQKIAKPYDDSFTKQTYKRIGGTHISSKRKRKELEFLERELQKQCDKYAESLGVKPLPLDNDGYPDRQYLLGTIIIGFVEYKVKSNSPREDQKKRIKELRERFDNDDAVRVFKHFDYFKEWLDRRVVLYKGVVS